MNQIKKLEVLRIIFYHIYIVNSYTSYNGLCILFLQCNGYIYIYIIFYLNRYYNFINGEFIWFKM